jgi:2-polyprenyl-3-methyl-5-hydroxy-6-metoxy-1,4-benzoquinol methylase
VLNADASDRVVFRTERADEFVSEPEAYDFVCMFDVLEHIPIPEHEAIFSTARKCIKKSGHLVVSIPNAASNRYLREHRPEALQPIDHELEVAALIELAGRVGLALHRFEEFDAWEEHQYHLFAFRPVKEYVGTEAHVPDPPTPLLARVQRRLRIRRTYRTFAST